VTEGKRERVTESAEEQRKPMDNRRTYRGLIIWQRGMQLSRMIYLATQVMPESERFGMTNQMRRA